MSVVRLPAAGIRGARLLAVARTRHRTALGLVVAGDVPGASWTWDLTEDGRLQAGVLGFEAAAQLLPAPTRTGGCGWVDGLNIPVRTLADLAFNQLNTARLSQVTLDPAGPTDTNLPTFVDAQLQPPARGPRDPVRQQRLTPVTPLMRLLSGS